MRPAYRSRWRLVSSTACSLLALAAAGCGGGAENPPPPAAPELSAALGESFAAQAEDVAELLSAGDEAGALEHATGLRDEIVAAIDAGDVPPALGKRLLAGIDRLIESIPPAEEPVEEPVEEEPEEEQDEAKDEDEATEEDPPEEDTTETDTTEIPDDVVPGNDKGNGNGNGNGNGKGLDG